MIHRISVALSLAILCSTAARADIIDIEHQRLFTGLAPRQAELDVVMETRGRGHLDQILATLQGAGFPTESL